MALKALGAKTVGAIRAVLPGVGAPGEGLWQPARRLLHPREPREKTHIGE
jgi:hypothetical protein